jgi:hypothetical protein
MTLRDLMALHARTTLVNLDHFGETVSYVPRDGSGARDVLAVVDRRGLEPARPGVPQGTRWVARVFVPRDDVVGVAAVADGDRIVLAMRLGDDPKSCRIERIVSQDEGAFELEVMS